MASGWRLIRLGLGLAALVAGLAGCDESLPGFANPPPYDSGQPDLDAAADDDGG